MVKSAESNHGTAVPHCRCLQWCTAQEQTSTGKTHEKADEAKSASKKVAHFRFESEALGKCTTLPAIANPPT